MVRLNTENQLSLELGSASKIWVGGWVVVVESEFSDRFGNSLRQALAKQNNFDFIYTFIWGQSPARRRRNHNMVEKGAHTVPTLRNRIVIFFAILSLK